jgi:hypothetical protein
MKKEIKTTEEKVNPFLSQFTDNEAREAFNEILSYTIDRIKDLGTCTNTDDLHNEIFNTDYFIIGYYQAEQFLRKVGVFKAIEVIKEYEEDNFGEVNTDLTEPEHVCNMYVYIIGEKILNNIETLSNLGGVILSEKEIDKIVKELESLRMVTFNDQR